MTISFLFLESVKIKSNIDNINEIWILSSNIISEIEKLQNLAQ
jgi:hypothetical protein